MAVCLWQFVSVQFGFFEFSLTLDLATTTNERKLCLIFGRFLDLALVFRKFVLRNLVLVLGVSVIPQLVSAIWQIVQGNSHKQLNKFGISNSTTAVVLALIFQFLLAKLLMLHYREFEGKC